MTPETKPLKKGPPYLLALLAVFAPAWFFNVGEIADWSAAKVFFPLWLMLAVFALMAAAYLGGIARSARALAGGEWKELWSWRFSHRPSELSELVGDWRNALVLYLRGDAATWFRVVRAWQWTALALSFVVVAGKVSGFALFDEVSWNLVIAVIVADYLLRTFAILRLFWTMVRGYEEKVFHAWKRSQ